MLDVLGFKIGNKIFIVFLILIKLVGIIILNVRFFVKKFIFFLVRLIVYLCLFWNMCVDIERWGEEECVEIKVLVSLLL